jgi:hypothetical protein
MYSINFSQCDVEPLLEITPGIIKKIGGWVVSGWSNDEETGNVHGPRVISPLHGRSAWLRHPEIGHVAIKGLGWTLGPVARFPSPKDSQLYFGLYALRDGHREWEVSEFLASNQVRATRVLGLASYPCDSKNAPRFLDGSLIEPCLLYSHSISPWRVADLTWLTPTERYLVVNEVAEKCGWRPDTFIEDFCLRLASSMAHYHRLGCINDSLSYDNLTLAAEITDFEWVTTPAQKLPDGSQYEDADTRLRKEAIYAYEIGCQLAHALGKPEKTLRIASLLYDGYVSGKSCTKETLLSLKIQAQRGGRPSNV